MGGRATGEDTDCRGIPSAISVGMTSREKISISLDRDDVAWAKKTAKKRKLSVSAVVAEALAQQRQAETRAHLLSELGDADISAADVEAMRRELQGIGKDARRNP